MRKGLALAVVGLLGCSPTGPSPADDKPAVSPSQAEPGGTAAPDAEAAPEPEVEAAPEPDAEAAEITVQMTAATLADDCGGGPKAPPPKPVPKAKRKVERTSKSRSKSDRARGAKAKRRCEQSSIQLAVTAPQGAKPAQVAIKSVELRLESGELVGTLQTREPSVWLDPDGYKPWDENIRPGEDLSVSYALTRPDWSAVEDRWNQTYTVKAVVSVAGSDQSVEKKVVVDAPTSLPPNVKT